MFQECFNRFIIILFFNCFITAGLSAEQKEIDHFLESERKFWVCIFSCKFQLQVLKKRKKKGVVSGIVPLFSCVVSLSEYVLILPLVAAIEISGQ